MKFLDCLTARLTYSVIKNPRFTRYYATFIKPGIAELGLSKPIDWTSYSYPQESPPSCCATLALFFSHDKLCINSSYQSKGDSSCINDGIDTRIIYHQCGSATTLAPASGREQMTPGCLDCIKSTSTPSRAAEFPSRVTHHSIERVYPSRRGRVSNGRVFALAGNGSHVGSKI